MGLDITAYSNLKPVGKHVETWCEDEDHVEVFSYADFPQSFRGIPVLATELNGDSTSFLVGGCFAITDETETHGFRAGSYTGYGHWRSALAEQFNPELDPNGPFYELIWFADNEGSIGPEAAADLLADFREHADRYAPMDLDWAEYSVKRYQDWSRACELAANSGLIRFH